MGDDRYLGDCGWFARMPAAADSTFAGGRNRKSMCKADTCIQTTLRGQPGRQTVRGSSEPKASVLLFFFLPHTSPTAGASLFVVEGLFLPTQSNYVTFSPPPTNTQHYTNTPKTKKSAESFEMKKAKTGKGRNGMGGDYSRHYDYDYAQGASIFLPPPPQLAISHLLQ
jgi:hypothetical protein